MNKDREYFKVNFHIVVTGVRLAFLGVGSLLVVSQMTLLVKVQLSCKLRSREESYSRRWQTYHLILLSTKHKFISQVKSGI